MSICMKWQLKRTFFCCWEQNNLDKGQKWFLQVKRDRLSPFQTYRQPCSVPQETDSSLWTASSEVPCPLACNQMWPKTGGELQSNKYPGPPQTEGVLGMWDSAKFQTKWDELATLHLGSLCAGPAVRSNCVSFSKLLLGSSD